MEKCDEKDQDVKEKGYDLCCDPWYTSCFDPCLNYCCDPCSICC